MKDNERNIKLITPQKQEIIIENVPKILTYNDIKDFMNKNSFFHKYQRGYNIVCDEKILKDRDIILGNVIHLQKDYVNSFIIFMNYLLNIMITLSILFTYHLRAVIPIYIISILMINIIIHNISRFEPYVHNIIEFISLYFRSYLPRFHL